MANRQLCEIMSNEPATILSSDTIQDAANLMSRRGIRHVVVLAPTQKPIGVVSQRDVFRQLATAGPQAVGLAVRAVMSEPLISVSSDTLVGEAAKKMVEYRIGCMAVVDDYKLIGIVTRSDLLAHAKW